MDTQSPYKPIFGLKRGGIFEVEIFGLYFVRVGQDIVTPETQNTVILSRSLLKPWQLSCCINKKSNDEHWVMGMSSSSGETVHIEALKSLSKFTDMDTEKLICPASYSYDSLTRAKQIVSSEVPQKKNHFCCGNHLAIKHACIRKNYNSTNYYKQTNPIHHKLSNYIAEKVSMPFNWTTDSCGVPTLIAPIYSFLEMWGGLGTQGDVGLDIVKELWLSNPVLVGGTERIDTAIIKAGKGKVLAKEGADGLLAVQSLGENQNFTLIIKLSQGATDDYLLLALKCILELYYEMLPEPLHNVLAYLKSRNIISKLQQSGFSFSNLLINSH